MKSISNPVALSKQAATEYQACYGDDLISAILYGSAAGGDFDAKRSDINLLIVLKEAVIEAMEKSANLQDKWIKQRFARPLFMDQDYIARSLDSFPIEFLGIKGCYQVLCGEDVLADLVIETRHIRLQLERELKGKRLHLMQQWLNVRKTPKLVEELLQVSMRDFAVSFRALLYLKDQEVPKNRNALFAAVEKAYGFDEMPFERTLHAFRSGDRKQMKNIFPAYAHAIKRLTEIVDQETVKEGT